MMMCVCACVCVGSPVCPEQMDWSQLYPEYFRPLGGSLKPDKHNAQVEFADIGCGYGGLMGNLCLFNLLEKISKYLFNMKLEMHRLQFSWLSC